MTEELKKDEIEAPASSSGEVLDQPVEAAAEVAAELEKEDQGIPADKTVEAIAENDKEQADAKAEPTADAATHDVSHLEPHIQKSGDQKDAEDAQAALAGTRAQLAGEHAKVGDGSTIKEEDLDPKKLSFTTADAKAVRGDPTDAKKAHDLSEERVGRIAQFKKFLATKILAGRKDMGPITVSSELPGTAIPFPNVNANQAVQPEISQPTQELPKAA